ncbi:MAG: M48 family metalloprotease [Promethearchaeati archaeon]
MYVKNGQRSELSDIVAIIFFFFLIYFLTKDLLTSLMGSFSIYLWVGVAELKEYPVINKILVISLVTYNIIFVSGLISKFLNNPIVLNTSFSFSFWIILILGFILFGRKYIVVWRFMSPQYLTLFLYILGWIGVVFINQYTPIDFLQYIYIILILMNVLIYFFSGFLLDKLLGIKRINNEKINSIVNEVKKNIGINSNVKIGLGKYPIVNAMAYGPFLDKRIAIIAEDLEKIPEDEIKGIIAHELAHTKANHTLILGFITIFDLIIRGIIGFPATYYDYTFGNPQIPFIFFLVINFGVYIFLYFFVRILEGFADRIAKNSGYGQELVKALYNLESFYASGREIGLNTMLLCEEKISRENKILDYMETAQYLNNSIIKPSKISLLGNFLNSHPPTYHRVIAILSDEISPYKETLLPLMHLRSKNQKKFAQQYNKTRKKFKEITNQKFKEMFNIEDISKFLSTLELREKHKHELFKNYLFKNLITGKYIYGQVRDIKFENDINNFFYEIFNHETMIIENLNSSHYTKKEVNVGDHYIFSKKKLLKLKRIQFDEDYNNGFYYFSDKYNLEIKKAIKKTKIPFSVENLQNFVGNEVFFKKRGVLEIAHCTSLYEKEEKLEEYVIKLKNSFHDIEGYETTALKLKELLIKPKNIQFEIKKNEQNKDDTRKILNWILKNQIRTYFYLKKPVNNLEIGYLQNIFHNSEQEKQMKKFPLFIEIRTIFNEFKKINLEIIEFVSFAFNTGIIQLKSEISLFSKIGYHLLKKIKPQKIYI